ncbi:heavy metal translocating P-type ATPase [Cyanobacterium aponinum AL20118]|uniref:Heavy metal translocating P-type ATPase n=1 Tax=Cyanobacterium aponinum AL20115 TaxID=3090662 RepID=A0AAF1C6H4_9CHRO|nr:heavy metal translocating P-type ATPase [Cyanobacterium aponinum]WPF90295.1 heavy metal translocating P-type ATPase [Cyanobacterium aponinum AL20115]
MISLESKLNSIDTLILDIQGMKCAACVKAVEKQITRHQGVICANVNLITAVASIEYEKGSIQPQSLAEKLTALGFPSQVRQGERIEEEQKNKIEEKRKQEQQKRIYELISAGLLLLFSTIGHLHHFGIHTGAFFSNIWFHWALATLALLIPGREILLNGWQGLWHGKPNMNSLVGIGATTAYLTSCIALIFPELGWECFFDEPVMLLGFIFLGRVLESNARYKAMDSLETLLGLKPQFARLVGKNNYEEDQGVKIPAVGVKVNEWVRVLSGEQFPVDGLIVKGKTIIDESLLTGESFPVSKGEGDKVSAGTINQENMVIVEAVNTGSKTVLGQIIATVEEAQTRKAPIQKIADVVSGYFAYGIMAIASLTFCFWYFWGTEIWANLLTELDTSKAILSVKLAIDVLVIACPCALGLATPTAILVGTTIGAEKGLLIKGGDILEQVKNLKTIVFDKTGTITEGIPSITTILSFHPEFNHQSILQIASSLEMVSNHPLAQGIIKQAQNQSLTTLKTHELSAVSGKGVKGIIEINEQLSWFYLGNPSWLEDHQISITTEILEQVNPLEAQGKTVVYLAQNSHIVGVIALGDKIRPFARETVKNLQNMGLEVMIMSGDRPDVVKYIAEKVGIEQYYGDLTPQGKCDLIQQIQQKNPHQLVAMVGDGINDAPAMSTAQIAIAMAQGAEVALKSAGIVLTRGKLPDLITAINLSKMTLKKIKQNLFWALSYNLVALPIAVGCLLPSQHFWLNPSTAGAFMAFSSIFVVTNSLLLKYTR